MFRMIIFGLILLCVSIVSRAASPAPLPPPTFVFTAIPDQNEQQLIERFSRVADYLKAHLGVPVRYIPVKSYAAAITIFRNNQVQLAWFGGLSGLRARRLVPGSQAIAQGVEDKHFVTYFIANVHSKIVPETILPQALLGATFTFGAKGSTSGRLMPEYYLRQRFHRSPAQIFNRVGFSGDHSRTIALVQAGSYAVGAVNYKVWQRELAAGKIDLGRVNVIWKTPAYQDYQWTLRAGVDRVWGHGFGARVTRALLELKDKKILAAFPRSGFIPAANSDYDALQTVARDIGLLQR